MLKNIEINEAAGALGELTGRRLRVRLIEGDKLGSTAYYPADVIRRDGPQVFKAGTPMFIDHQTAEEKANKPFGSVGTFVGELATDAVYETDGLYADVEVFEDAAPMIKARANRIGVSVRADIVAEEGEIDGRRVPIAKQFTKAKSVDFVMRPGAGGRVVSILESAVEEPQTEAEESGDTMTKEEFEAILAPFATRLTAIEESLRATAVAEVETVEESAVDVEAKALEIAEAFAGSSLDAEGRTRVLALHKGTGKSIVELIEAEEAYVKAHTTAETVGVEESAEATVEVEESATERAVPRAWTRK